MLFQKKFYSLPCCSSEMLINVFAILSCLAFASSRESKTIKSLPSISSSLVNLGKMDITFHINTRLPDAKVDPVAQTSFFTSKSDPEDPCLCGSPKGGPFRSSLLNNPAEMINKILMSNDLFSYNKDPVSSITCCDSHEHVQEDTFFFEFGPKLNPHTDLSVASNGNVMSNVLPPNTMPFLPFILDNFIPNKPAPVLPIVAPMKPKAIEIFFFPKKGKESLPTFEPKNFSKKKDVGKKSEIQLVGDKELRNDFKKYEYKFRPSISLSAFGKKDSSVTREEKSENKVSDNTEETTISVPAASSPNSI